MLIALPLRCEGVQLFLFCASPGKAFWFQPASRDARSICASISKQIVQLLFFAGKCTLKVSLKCVDWQCSSNLLGENRHFGHAMATMCTEDFLWLGCPAYNKVGVLSMIGVNLGFVFVFRWLSKTVFFLSPLRANKFFARKGHFLFVLVFCKRDFRALPAKSSRCPW